MNRSEFDELVLLCDRIRKVTVLLVQEPSILAYYISNELDYNILDKKLRYKEDLVLHRNNEDTQFAYKTAKSHVFLYNSELVSPNYSFTKATFDSEGRIKRERTEGKVRPFNEYLENFEESIFLDSLLYPEYMQEANIMYSYFYNSTIYGLRVDVDMFRAFIGECDTKALTFIDGEP